jgi:hypothetical protein
MFDEQQEQLKERCENIWIKIEDLMITVQYLFTVPLGT